MPEISPAVLSAVRSANRLLEHLSTQEQEQALAALVEVGTEEEARSANEVLYLQREREKAQMKLRNILDSRGGARS